jgi:hypothetical protein
MASLLRQLSKSISNENFVELERRASQDNPDVVCEFTILQKEVMARHDAAEALITNLSVGEMDPTKVYMPSMLEGIQQ